MKKILYILTGVAFLSSCEGYFDQLPKTELPAVKVYETYDGALRNLAVLYARLGNADGGINGSGRFAMPSLMNEGSFKLNSQSDIPRNLWNNYYNYIAQANLIMENLETYASNVNNTYENSTLESAELTGDPVDQLMGEARFLRAYAYFNLYRYFGGVPLITRHTGPRPAYIPRSTRQEMFRFLYEEMDDALRHCADNNSGIAEGRVTRGAVAAFLAKMKVFHASYIRRAEKYGAKLGETTDGDLSTATLYSDAEKLCDDIIGGVYGSYKLEEYYPSVFTKRNKEVILSALAEEGQGTGNKIPMGFEGTGKHGAVGGTHLTSWMTLLYDIPMWEHNYRIKDVCRDYGQIDCLNNETAKPGTTPNDLQNLYERTKEYTITGDSTRRMWVSVKGWVTGPNDGGAPKGLWVFEPAGRFLGSEFYIEPGKINDYTADQLLVFEKALESHERPWWRNEKNGENHPNLWKVNWWQLGKFRNLNPWDLGDTFEIDLAGVDYPLIRLAEVYLLKAEAQLMQGDKEGAVRSMNVLRDRACYQSTTRDMFLSQGDASYQYIAGSVMPIPESISADEALKELLYERLRELAGEDDCGWLDVTRYPEIAMVDLEDIGRYYDPLHGVVSFSDPSNNEYLWNLFNEEMVYKVLLPIPFTELSYYPEMKQNPGYL